MASRMGAAKMAVNKTKYRKGSKMKKLILFLICFMMMSVVGRVEAAKFIAKGATSQSISVVIKYSDGDPNDGTTTALDITNLNLYCLRDGAHGMKDWGALAAHAADDNAWDDLEAFHMGKGVYRIDIPDANMTAPVGTMLTYIISDTATNNQTSYYEVQLSPPVNVDAVGTNQTVPTNQVIVYATDFATGYDTTLDMWNADMEAVNGTATPTTMAQLVSDSMSQANIETYSQTGSNAALVALNLDHLLKVTTGIAVDADQAAVIVDNSVMSLLMSPTGGVSDDFDSSTDSHGSIGGDTDEILVDTARFDTTAEVKSYLFGWLMTDLAAGAPAYNADAATALNWLYEAWRNKSTTNATEYRLYKDNTTTIATEADVTDDGTTFTKDEMGAED